MNQWKRDLDGIVGDVSEQKKRLVDGVAKKLHRKKKNRKPVFVGVVALLAVAISLFLLSEQMQVKEQQANYHAEYAMFEGMVIAYAIEQKRILVVTDATHEDILMLPSEKIIEKYENGVWFTMDKMPPTLTPGDVVQVSYEFIEEALPAQSEAINVKITEDFSCENLLHFSCFGAGKGFTGFYGSGYASKYNNHIVAWGEDGLRIFGHYNSGASGKPNDLDTIMELEGAKVGDFFTKVYENAEIMKEGNQYIVKLTDELSLTFEIIGPRTIKDTTGAEYTTQMYTEE